MHHHFTIPFLILLISTTSHEVRLFNAQGRKVGETADGCSKRLLVKDEKTRWRVQIGSKPPRCDRRCGVCAHCEAIQVPTNPQMLINGRDDDNSNYKPMSWKCKCGNLIFNP